MLELCKSSTTKPRISFQLDGGVLFVEMETDNLYVRSYKDEDFEDCVMLYGDEAITKFFDHGKPRSREEVEDYVAQRGRRYFDQGEPFGLFSIFDKRDMAFMGQVDLLPTGEPGVVEVGYIIHKQYQNRGFGTEVVNAIMFDYVREVNLSKFLCGAIPVFKIIATVHPDNQSSIRILEKLGMTFDRNLSRFCQPRLWYSVRVPQMPKIIKVIGS